jgi:hypothetical protein
MASYKLNIAKIQGAPPARELLQLFNDYGLPDDEEFGVLDCSASDEVLYASILRKTHQAIQRFDGESGEISTTAVEKASILRVGIFPKRCVIELYDGTASSFDYMTNFLGSHLALPIVIDTIDMDIPASVRFLQKSTKRFVLKSIRVSDYAHSSYMIGPYTPKFLETEAGMDFLEEYTDFTTSASCRFQTSRGRATVTLTPKTCLRFTLSNEEDKAEMHTLLRKMA